MNQNPSRTPEENPAKPLRLVISLDGGLITAIASNGAYPVEIVSVDYDVEGLEVDELMDIPLYTSDCMPSEDTEEAYAFNRDGEVFFAPEWVDAVFRVVDQEDAP